VAAAVTLASAFVNRPAPSPEATLEATSVPAERPALDLETPVPAAEATPAPEFVRIANTGGTGAFIREEPRAAARGIVAHTERTVLKIIGGDVQSEGRTWRNVEDQRGNRGWTPGEYLVASDAGF
jgi:hypothetical protein